jgi:hypothetical protein
MKNQKVTDNEMENLEAERNYKAFEKLKKLHTDEAYKAYVKAQKNYISVLKKFIKKNVADRASYAEKLESSTTYCLENQWEAWWAYLEQPENQIKILDCLISSHQDSLLDPDELLDQ